MSENFTPFPEKAQEEQDLVQKLIMTEKSARWKQLKETEETSVNDWYQL